MDMKQFKEAKKTHEEAKKKVGDKIMKLWISKQWRIGKVCFGITNYTYKYICIGFLRIGY